MCIRDRGGVGTTENFTSFSRNEAASAMSVNDEVANLTFNDLTGYEFARIQVLADAATGATDTPGRIVFKTTADGASSSTNRLTIKSSGEVLVGHDTVIGHNGVDGYLQVTGTGSDSSSFNLNRFSADNWCPFITFGKSRNATKGSHTVVQDGDYIGYIQFAASDGTDFNNSAANIICQIDGTPGTDDTPGRLIFQTCADGTNSPTERLRITSAGNLALGSSTNKTDIHSSWRSIQVYNSAYIWGYTSGSYPAVHLTNNARPTTGSFTSGWKRDLTGTYTAPVQVELYHGDFNVRTADNDAADSAISWDTRFSIKQAGDVQVKTGNLVIGTAGKGIDFSATGGPTSEDEVLEDYERGTWNPGFTFGGNNANWSWTSEGHYEKIGNVVTCIGMLDFTAKNSSYSTGAANITGLPYTVADIMVNTSQEGAGWFTYFANMGTNGYSYYDFWVQGGNTTCSIQRHNNSYAISTANDGDFNSNTQLRFWISYFTG